MGYFFKVFLVLAVLSHYSYPAKKSEEAEGNCSSFVVSPQKGTAASIGLWTDPYSFCTGQTPFQRSCFLGQNPCCNPCSNDEEASFLEVLTLPCCDEGDVPQMLEVWNGMASMHAVLAHEAGSTTNVDLDKEESNTIRTPDTARDSHRCKCIQWCL